jgi:hypothetical protein
VVELGRACPFGQGVQAVVADHLHQEAPGRLVDRRDHLAGRLVEPLNRSIPTDKDDPFGQLIQDLPRFVVMLGLI